MIFHVAKTCRKNFLFSLLSTFDDVSDVISSSNSFVIKQKETRDFHVSLFIELLNIRLTMNEEGE